MDDKLKEEFLKYFELNKEPFILGDARLNVFVNNYFITPYNHLDYVRKHLGEKVKEYSLYFVMSCARREIISYVIKQFNIILTYMDYGDNKRKQISFDLRDKLNADAWFLQPIMAFFEYEIRRCGSSFKVSISKENMTYIKEHFPYLYSFFPEECKLANLYFNEYDIHRLLLDEKSITGETEKYDLLYIGKSTAKDYDIIDRLSCHKTIQKINRENNSSYRDKELMVLLIEPKSELFKEKKGDFVNVGLRTRKWEDTMLLNDMREKQDVVPFIEIILINHFKPKYNKMYVDNLSMGSKLYEKFKDEDVNPISIEFDMNNGKGRYEIRTKKTVTTTRMRNIECYKKQDEIIIKYYDMPEIIYDFL